MQLVVPDLGELYLSKALLQGGAEATEDWLLALYGGGPIPNRSVVLADYAESSFPGYARQPMPRSAWTDPVLVNHLAVSYHGLGYFEFFSASGSYVAKGFMVLNNAADTLLWVEQFDVEQLVTVNVPAMVQPIMRLRSILQPLPP